MITFHKLKNLKKPTAKRERKLNKDYKITVLKDIATLKAGKGFGELALKNSAPRAASIKATED